MSSETLDEYFQAAYPQLSRLAGTVSPTTRSDFAGPE